MKPRTLAGSFLLIVFSWSISCLHAASPLVWFPLDEGAINNTTNIVHDKVSGLTGTTNGNSGTGNLGWNTAGLGPVPLLPPVTGTPGTYAALSLSGTNAIRTTASVIALGLTNTNPRTVAAWVKLAGSQVTANPTIVGWGPNTTGQRFDLRITASGTNWLPRIELTSSGSFSGTSNLYDGNWHHVAVVYAPGASASALYIDGSLDTAGTLTPSATLPTSNTTNICIGDSYADTGRKFTGQIDDVRIYNSALALSDIQGIALSPAITATLTNQTVECGGNATFSAGISALPAAGTLNYQWSVNGADIAGATGTTFTTNNVHAAGSVYTITVRASNSYGSATNSALLNVVDTTPPVITLNGANPLSVNQGSSFTDPGATALDACAGSVSVSTSGSVNTSVPGTYTLTYIATDGSNSATNTRTVNVIALGVAPTFTTSLTNESVQCAGNASFYGVATGTTPLNYYWSINGVLVATGVDLHSLSTNNVHSAGNVYGISLIVSNSVGTATNLVNLTVIDTTGPVVTVTGVNPLTIAQNSVYVEYGATAVDACAGVVSLTSTNSTVNPAVGGTYTVTYSANDGNGNIGTATRTVIVTPTDGIWTNTLSDVWSNSANWTNAIVPLGIGTTADFSQIDITSDTTVHVDEPVTVGNLLFGDTDNTSPANWIVDNNGVPANLLTLAAISGSPIVQVNGLATGEATTLAVELHGTQGFTKTGNSTLSLSISNAYSGPTVVSNGTVILNDPNALGFSPAVSVSSGAVVNLNGQTLTNQFTIAGTGISAGGALVNLSGSDASLSNSLTLTAAASVSASSGNLVLSGPISGGFNFSTLGSYATEIYGTNTCQGSTWGSGTVNGGQVVLGSANAVGYGTVLLQGAQIQASAAGIVITNPISISTGGFRFGGTNSLTITGNLTLQGGNRTIGNYCDADPGTLTVNGNINNNGGVLNFEGDSSGSPVPGVYVNGNITGAGGLALLADFSSRTLTLSGSNSYAGATTINTGTLLVNGTNVAAGGVTVPGGTLGGTGTIIGAVNVSGGNISPGNGTNTATLHVIGALTVSGGAVMSVNTATPTNDLVTGIGTLTYGGTLTVSNLAGNLNIPATYVLFSATNYVGDFGSLNLPTPASGFTWNWTATNGTLVLAPIVNTNPTNLTFTVTGHTLALSWPADHLGWHVQAQTNALNKGVGTNWVTIPGSDTVTSTSITIDPAQPAVFYRLTYP